MYVHTSRTIEGRASRERQTERERHTQRQRQRQRQRRTEREKAPGQEILRRACMNAAGLALSWQAYDNGHTKRAGWRFGYARVAIWVYTQARARLMHHSVSDSSLQRNTRLGFLLSRKSDFNLLEGERGCLLPENMRDSMPLQYLLFGCLNMRPCFMPAS